MRDRRSHCNLRQQLLLRCAVASATSNAGGGTTRVCSCAHTMPAPNGGAFTSTAGPRPLAPIPTVTAFSLRSSGADASYGGLLVANRWRLCTSHEAGSAHALSGGVGKKTWGLNVASTYMMVHQLLTNTCALSLKQSERKKIPSKNKK